VRGVAGLPIVIVGEEFGQAQSKPAIDEKVRSAAARLAMLGAINEEISIPTNLGGATNRCDLLLMPTTSLATQPIPPLAHHLLYYYNEYSY
jgi:hypothetical protein